MVTTDFSLRQFSEHFQAKPLFQKKICQFKRHFWFLDILKMSFFEKSRPDLKTSFFFRNFYRSINFS